MKKRINQPRSEAARERMIRRIREVNLDGSSRKDYGVPGMKWGEHKEDTPSLKKGEVADSSDLFKSGEENYTKAVKGAEIGSKIMCSSCAVTKIGDNDWLVEDNFGDGGSSGYDDDFILERIEEEDW